MEKEKVLDFLEFRKMQKKVVFEGVTMYDVFGKHKYLTESELINYYVNVYKQSLTPTIQ